MELWSRTPPPPQSGEMPSASALSDPLLGGGASWKAQKRSPVVSPASAVWRQNQLPRPKPPDTSWANACSAALPVAMMNLAQAYTYAALVCMGTGLDVGMVSAMHMLGLIVVQAVFCVGSGVPNFAIASSDITIALLNHKIVREVYAEDSRVPLHAQHDTALCVLCVCAVVQGALYLALGRMRAAEMVQYLPHPVVAGLLALTGCCVIRGALAVITGVDLSVPTAEAAAPQRSLLELVAAWPQQVAAAAALGLLVVQLSRSFNPAIAFLLSVPATLTLFYAVVGFQDASMGDLVTHSWVFPPHEARPLHALWTSRNLSEVHWPALVPDDPLGYAAASLVCMVFAMLKNLAVESGSLLAVELHHELSCAGVANILCGLCGGVSANHAASYISVLRNARVANRRVPAMVALLTAAVLLSGFPVANYIPRFLARPRRRDRTPDEPPPRAEDARRACHPRVSRPPPRRDSSAGCCWRWAARWRSSGRGARAAASTCQARASSPPSSPRASRGTAPPPSGWAWSPPPPRATCASRGSTRSSTTSPRARTTRRLRARSRCRPAPPPDPRPICARSAPDLRPISACSPPDPISARAPPELARPPRGAVLPRRERRGHAPDRPRGLRVRGRRSAPAPLCGARRDAAAVAALRHP